MYKQMITLRKLALLAIILLLASCSDAGSQAGAADTKAPQLLNAILINGSVSGVVGLSWSMVDDNPLEVQVWLSKDSGETFTTKLATVAHDRNSPGGNFQWDTDTPATPDGAGYQLKLLAIDIPNNQTQIVSPIFDIDNSGGVGSPTAPTIFLTAPTGNFTINGNIDITWNSNTTLGTVDITLSEDGGRTYPITIASGIANNGSYTWDSSAYTGKLFRFSLTVTKAGITNNIPSQSSLDLVIDNTAPAVVDSALRSSNPAADGITIDWTAAQDSISAQNALRYRLYYSDSNNISTLSLIDANGIDAIGSTISANTYTVSGIANAANKYWNIVVEDEVGLRATYAAMVPTGIPVLGFGNNGVVIYDSPEVSSDDDVGEAVIIDNNGKLLVVGHKTASFETVLKLWRYDKQGSLDLSFGDNNAAGTGKLGSTTLANPLATYDYLGKAVAIDSANRIVVVGYGQFAEATGTSTRYDIIVWRFDNTGKLDTTFGIGGVARYANLGSDYGYSVAIGPMNSIIVSGELTVTTGYRDMVLMKFDAFGVLDQNFGSNGTGVVTHDGAAGGSDGDSGESVAIDSKGNIVVAGYSTTASVPPVYANYDLAVWRFDSNGIPDANFGNNASDPGVVTHHGAAGGEGNDRGFRMLIDSNDNVVIVGESVHALIEPDPLIAGDWYTFDYDMVIWRYDSTGQLDSTFNGTGFVTRGLNEPLVKDISAIDQGWAVAIDNNNNIVVAGLSQIGGFYATAIWRYKDNGAPDSSFGNNGEVVQRDPLNSGSIVSNMAYGLSVDSVDNSIFVTGYKKDPQALFYYDMLLMHYQ